MKGFTINEMSVGQSASFSKTITESDVYLFAGVSGDMNPAHIDEEYAKNSIFKSRVAHGVLGNALVSTVLGTKLPGPGTIYMQSNVKYTAPVYFGDTLTAGVTVKELIVEKNRVVLDVLVEKQDGTKVLTGDALVMAPK